MCYEGLGGKLVHSLFSPHVLGGNGFIQSPNKSKWAADLLDEVLAVYFYSFVCSENSSLLEHLLDVLLAWLPCHSSSMINLRQIYHCILPFFLFLFWSIFMCSVPFLFRSIFTSVADLHFGLPAARLPALSASVWSSCLRSWEQATRPLSWMWKVSALKFVRAFSDLCNS